MKKNNKVWVVGQYRGERASGLINWDFQGVFTNENSAIEACIKENYFIAPTTLNKQLPGKTIEWPGAYYPLKASNENQD